MYRVFTRIWWRNNPNWPNDLEPCADRKHTLGKMPTEEMALALCKQYNDTHNAGRLSRKAEYEEIT